MIDDLRIKNAILEEKLLFKMKQATYYKKKYLEDHRKLKKAREYIEIIVKNTPSSMRKDYANMLLIDYKKLLAILDKGE